MSLICTLQLGVKQNIFFTDLFNRLMRTSLEKKKNDELSQHEFIKSQSCQTNLISSVSRARRPAGSCNMVLLDWRKPFDKPVMISW